MELMQAVYRTKSSEMYFDQEGILWVKPKEDAEIDLDEVKACFEVYRQMGAGKENKVLQLIDARLNFTMSREAREHTANEGRNFFIASAVISENLPVRLLVNFFGLFYKHQVSPIKLFSSEEAARSWLLRFR
ncbi:MAG TPA: hypothetical protein VF868_15495 [Bacteroidia bacterium]|jgi:hypothetical protein